MQTNDKPNEVLKCQKLKRCVSIPAPNDRIGFVLLLVLLMHVYIYIYNYIYIIWTYFRQSNMAMENHLFSSMTFPLKLSFSAAIFQPAMFDFPRVSCPDLPPWRWGMHGEGRYEWPDGRAYEGHGWFGLPLEHGVVNVLLWVNLSITVKYLLEMNFSIVQWCWTLFSYRIFTNPCLKLGWARVHSWYWYHLFFR